jgi:hypothetical protein
MNGYTTLEPGLAPAICKASSLRLDEGLGRRFFDTSFARQPVQLPQRRHQHAKGHDEMLEVKADFWGIFQTQRLAVANQALDTMFYPTPAHQANDTPPSLLQAQPTQSTQHISWVEVDLRLSPAYISPQHRPQNGTLQSLSN